MRRQCRDLRRKSMTVMTADIRVPAHIQMEGYDIPPVCEYPVPVDGREDIWRDEVPVKFNPVASYVKYFTLPQDFVKQGLYISFQGVESGFCALG